MLSDEALTQRLRDLADGLASLRNASDRPGSNSSRPAATAPASFTSAPGGSAAAAKPLGTSPLLPVTAGPRPLGGEARANMVHRLMLDVERKAGIKVGPQVEQKLLRLLNDLPPEELAGWVASMESADPDNPDYLSMIESLTVHETYFYRDKPQLDHLRQNVFPKLVAGRRTMSRPTLTIWSAASSTGEEPYTFAMMALLALLEAGEASENANAITPNPRWGITVVGTDISRQALRTARDATYAVAGLSSFRDLPKELERFFIAPPRDMAAEAGGIARTVRQDVRNLVRFQRYNLLDPRLPISEADIVACRNVLVYFDAEGRRKVQNHCHKALKVGGILTLGPADTLELPDRFRTVWGPATVMYEKLG